MIINVIESLIASYFFTNYFNLKINKYLYFAINFVLICSEINIDNLYYSYSITLPLVVASTAAVIAYFYANNNIWEVIFITFLDQLVVGISIIISLMIEELVDPNVRIVVGKILYLFMVYTILYICKTRMIKLNEIYWKLLTVVVIVFYFAYTILLQFYLGMELNRSLVYVTLLSLVLSVIGIAVIVYYISKLEQKHQETQFSLQKLEMEQSNYVQLSEVSKEIHIMRHDLKHDYQLINNYLEDNEYSKIKEIVNSRVEELNEVGISINSANELINTIINYKMMIAHSKGIDVNFEINVSEKLHIKDYHLNELLSNLLDNAIENCSKNNPQIDIYMEEDIVVFYLEVVNKIDKSVLKSNPELNTSKKKGHHGHGIKSIQRIVNEYKGSIKIFEKDSEFHVSIIIPLNRPH